MKLNIESTKVLLEDLRYKSLVDYMVNSPKDSYTDTGQARLQIIKMTFNIRTDGFGVLLLKSDFFIDNSSFTISGTILVNVHTLTEINDYLEIAKKPESENVEFKKITNELIQSSLNNILLKVTEELNKKINIFLCNTITSPTEEVKFFNEMV